MPEISVSQEVWPKAGTFHMVSDPAALAEDLSVETSKLDLGAVVDTLAKTSCGDRSISGTPRVHPVSTSVSSESRALGSSQGNVTTPTGRLWHPGVSVCSPRAPDQLGSVCNVGFSPSPAVSTADTPDTGDLTAALGAALSLHHCWR